MSARVYEFNVEGRPVQCHESDGHRLWRCECAYFQRTFTTYREGFCPHVVIAIETFLRDGAIASGSRNRLPRRVLCELAIPNRS
jgi:hypothetical protein